MKSSQLILPFAGALLLLAGCESAPTPPPTTTVIRCRVPVIATLPETKEAQEKGGLEITIVPSTYAAVREEFTTTHQMAPGFGSMLSVALVTGGHGAGLVYVEETTTPALRVEPGRLRFTVRINNKLARVFRGQGAVVQFNVAGKLVPFDKTDYKEFLNGIVPPRNEAEFMIQGPAIDALPEKGSIGIFLYDVVTATDMAGTVTEKQNYEWYFSYTLRTEERSGEVKKVQGTMEPAAFQARMMQEAQRRARLPQSENP